jgi:osmoprotectant transport system permease protein
MDISIDWAWVGSHGAAMWARFLQHLQLVGIAVVAGFALSLVLAIWAYRQPRVFTPITAITGLLYTIPSLAAFALLRPFTGLTLLTAVVPLTTYTLLILVRANVAGFQSVPADVLEAAEGMGYTRRERLVRVELPLALPLIMAGIRLAVVTTIGLATVASILGESFGGFGFFITEGLDRFFLTEIYVGAVLSILMAFSADFLLVRIERLVTPWTRVRAGAR